jgi:hypothetical protein
LSTPEKGGGAVSPSNFKLKIACNSNWLAGLFIGEEGRGNPSCEP